MRTVDVALRCGSKNTGTVDCQRCFEVPAIQISELGSGARVMAVQVKEVVPSRGPDRITGTNIPLWKAEGGPLSENAESKNRLK